MKSPNPQLPYDRTSAYERLLNKFVEAVEEAGGQVKEPDAPVVSCFTRQGTASVEFKRCLYLKDCPCRRKPKGLRLDIAISILEKIALNGWSLDQSTVYVNYFLVEGRKASLVQALHYDLSDVDQECHPFFHVHLTAQRVCLSEFSDVDLGIDSRVDKPETAIATRIPTSDMTVASVLYCLAADHLDPSIFEKFASAVHGIQGELPAVCFDHLQGSLDKNRTHFKSSHWFAHALKKAPAPPTAGARTVAQRARGRK
jgi:hypothetical protein